MSHLFDRPRPLGIAGVAAVLIVIVAAVVTASVASAAKKPTIGFANPIASNPGQQAAIAGARAAANFYGFNLKIADANMSADKQVSDINSFKAQKVAGILTWTLNQGAADGAYRSARAAGIPVVGYSSTSKFINSTIAFLSVSTCAPMNDAASLIAKSVPNAKVLVIAGPSTVPSLAFMTKCFSAAAKAAGLQIVDTQENTANTPAAAQQIAADALTRFPDLQAIWAFNDGTGLGASAALNAANKPVWSGTQKGIILIGNDGNAAGVEAIKAHQYTATYDANVALGGAMGSFVLARYIKLHKPFPKVVNIPFLRIDSSNAGSFVDPVKRKVTFSGACASAGGVKVCVPKK